MENNIVVTVFAVALEVGDFMWVVNNGEKTPCWVARGIHPPLHYNILVHTIHLTSLKKIGTNIVIYSTCVVYLTYGLLLKILST